MHARWLVRAGLTALLAGTASGGGAAAPAPLIVAFGDSLTEGHGAPPGQSYPDYLQTMLRAEGFDYRVENQGVSGDTTADGLARIGAVIDARPAIVILEFGGNDGLRGLPVASTRANLQAMVTRLRQAHIPILLAGMSLPPNYGPDYINSFQRIYTELARTDHLALIPFLYQDLVAKLPRQSGLLQEDGIHATAAGNKVVAATVLHYLRPLLQPAPQERKFA